MISRLVRRDPSRMLFAITDKARGGAMAGVIGLINASVQNLSAEIGWVLAFPAFQPALIRDFERRRHHASIRTRAA